MKKTKTKMPGGGIIIGWRFFNLLSTQGIKNTAFGWLSKMAYKHNHALTELSQTLRWNDAGMTPH